MKKWLILILLVILLSKLCSAGFSSKYLPCMTAVLNQGEVGEYYIRPYNRDMENEAYCSIVITGGSEMILNIEDFNKKYTLPPGGYSITIYMNLTLPENPYVCVKYPITYKYCELPDNTSSGLIKLSVCYSKTIYVLESCNKYDRLYYTNNTKWLNASQCTEKEQKEQEYRDYSCATNGDCNYIGECSYTTTNTQWVDTNNTRNKDDKTSCNDDLWCTVNNQCISGVCGGIARDCSDGNESTNDICNEDLDKCEHTIKNFSVTHYCNTTNILHNLRKALYIYYINPSTIAFTANDLKDLLTFYLNIRAEITIDCTSHWNKIDLTNKLQDTIPTCSDGTKYGKCSNNKPLYCYTGRLVPRCSLCECDTEKECQVDGSCI